MFERFTARGPAGRRRRPGRRPGSCTTAAIGTEHLLLGLLGQDTPDAPPSSPGTA